MTDSTPSETSNDYASQHALVEKNRRTLYRKLIEELSSIIHDLYDTKSAKLSETVVLQSARQIMAGINLQCQHDPLLPSHLTKDEMHFLNFEASNAFLFVTTMESPTFRIIYVSDAINRVLHVTSQQWLDQNLCTFLHPNDVFTVQNQLISLTQEQVKKNSPIQCRLMQGNGSYSSVIIDGIVKRTDQSLKPVSPNEWGYSVFIGICYLPLTSEYNEKNMSLYKNPQSLVFSCRCSPDNWKILLVDRSITTLASVSFDVFRDRSILDFIHIDDQASVHQTLVNVTLTAQDELVICRFICSSTDILTMIVDIKPQFNPCSQQIGFIELTFKTLTDFIDN